MTNEELREEVRRMMADERARGAAAKAGRAEVQAQRWEDQIQDRVDPLLAFTRLVSRTTGRWVRDVLTSRGTVYTTVKGFVRDPLRSVKNFIWDREIESLAAMWTVQALAPIKHSGKTYPVIKCEDGTPPAHPAKEDVRMRDSGKHKMVLAILPVGDAPSNGEQNSGDPLGSGHD